MTKTYEEREELRLYEKWSLTVALSRVERDETEHIDELERHENVHSAADNGGATDANEYYVHVMRCPRPDCECFWLSNQTYRRQKLDNEQKFTKTRKRTMKLDDDNNEKETTNLNSSMAQIKIMARDLFKVASNWLFFNPIKPEEEEAIMSNNGYTTEHWLEADSLHIFHNVNLTMEASLSRKRHRDGGFRDGRKVLCPKCFLSFCGLCLRPWSTFSKHAGGKRVFHSNQLCADYQKQSLSRKDDDFALTADTVDARCCPGCSMRTSRTMGCNHMKCFCGVEWCYICECRWGVHHYRCQDGGLNNDGGNVDNNFDGCFIS